MDHARFDSDESRKHTKLDTGKHSTDLLTSMRGGESVCRSCYSTPQIYTSCTTKGRRRNKETTKPAFKSNLRQKYCTEKETTCSRTEKTHLQRKTSSKKLTRVHRNQILSDICYKTGTQKTRHTTHFIHSLSFSPLSPTPFLNADLYTSY
jgi:hypothetical protein